MGSKRLNIEEVVRESGTNRNTITRLYHETNNRIDLENLEKLCQCLEC
ncbi:helix-turn-helix domain-containing protein [Vibrio sp. 10N.261.51.F12]